MRILLLLLLLPFFACQSGSEAPDSGDQSPVTPEEDKPALTLKVESFQSEITTALFGEEPEFEVLIEGMDWSEGPLALPDGSVICSDVPKNHIRSWKAGKSGTYLTGSGGAKDDYSGEPGSNGLHLDAKGRLLLCQHGSRSVVRMDAPVTTPAARFTVLADNYRGKRFNSPNDLVVAKDGSILFTDPIYGLPGKEKSELRELDYCGIYRIKPDGEVQLLTKEYERPNGIGLSPDQKTLYVGNSDRSYFVVTATPILDENFTLGERQELINATNLVGKEIGSCDGLAVAQNGRIFATAPGGVWVMEPDGELIAKIRTGQKTSNVEISPREDYVYLTSDYYLIRLKLY
ncbi:MAG: SMP-30/gluconolactonase/LRE family protein [Bacteroidota bacterium]